MHFYCLGSLPSLLQVTAVSLQQANIKRSSITAANLRFSLALSLCKLFYTAAFPQCPALPALTGQEPCSSSPWEPFSSGTSLKRSTVRLWLIWTSGVLNSEAGRSTRTQNSGDLGLVFKMNENSRICCFMEFNLKWNLSKRKGFTRA